LKDLGWSAGRTFDRRFSLTKIRICLDIEAGAAGGVPPAA